MVRLRVICCSTVTRAPAFWLVAVAPRPTRPGSTRKRVMPKRRSRRPPTWLEMASERRAVAPAVFWAPPAPEVRTVDSRGLAEGEEGDDIAGGKGRIGAIGESELAGGTAEIEGDFIL